MSIDFLNNSCKEAIRTEKQFGLCDNQDGKKAYSDSSNPDSWIALVQNNLGKSLTFVPVDKCLINDYEYPDRGRCDGLLISDEHLLFVELKNQARNWIAGAIEQLDSTVEFFKAEHDINQFKHKMAYACNKQHIRFQVIDHELNKAFFKKHKVRLDVQSTILIV